MDGFSSDDLADPYGTLPEEYRTIYEMEFNKNRGIKTVCVQTEKGFYTEKVYQSMGFYEVMLGEVYGQKEN